MPDVFTYLGYLAAKTSRIRLGTAVVTVPLYEPVRVVENLAFVDILSGGRVMIGLGSGYRPYEFAGFGRDFAGRHARQEEAIVLILELLHTRRTTHQGPDFHATIAGEYEGAYSHISGQVSSRARCEVAICFNIFHRPAL